MCTVSTSISGTVGRGAHAAHMTKPGVPFVYLTFLADFAA